jgi:hypothetical protein
MTAIDGTILSLSDLNTTVNHEPRVLDTLVAERLGFERPRAMRQLIDRNKVEFETYGSLATRRGKSRGQEFTEYFLNEPQALLACALSRTPKAAQVRKALIEVFMAYRSGRLTADGRRGNAPAPTQDAGYQAFLAMGLAHMREALGASPAGKQRTRLAKALFGAATAARDLHFVLEGDLLEAQPFRAGIVVADALRSLEAAREALGLVKDFAAVDDGRAE